MSQIYRVVEEKREQWQGATVHAKSSEHAAKLLGVSIEAFDRDFVVEEGVHHSNLPLNTVQHQLTSFGGMVLNRRLSADEHAHLASIARLEAMVSELDNCRFVEPKLSWDRHYIVDQMYRLRLHALASIERHFVETQSLATHTNEESVREERKPKVEVVKSVRKERSVA